MYSKSEQFPLAFNLLLIYLIIKSYQITNLPFANTIKNFEFYYDIIILFLYIILITDFKLTFKVSFINIFLFALLFLFLYSSFVINSDYNYELNTILKLLTYIFVFVSFFFGFAKIIYFKINLFKEFISYILYLSLILSLLAIIFKIFNINLDPRFPIALNGIFNHPNTFSFIFTFSIPILIYKYLNKEIRFQKFLVFLFILGSTLAFTFSRAGYLAVLLSTLILIAGKSKKALFIFIIAIIVVISSFFFEIQSLKEDSSLARGILIYTALSLITDNNNNMIWGYGVNRATEVFYDQKTTFGNFEINVNNPHNFLLLLSLQFGVLLAIFYFLFIIIILIYSLFKLNRKAILKLEIMLCISIICGLLIQNFFEELLVVPEFPIMALGLIFLGYLYYFNKYESKRIG
jgi:hypothetical protein